MMLWAGVPKERLKRESLIPTDFGETLSWEYYEYVKAHPITRRLCRTDIFYAGNDNITEWETVDKFVEQFHTSLTVMENGEHWFHTPGRGKWPALHNLTSILKIPISIFQAAVGQWV